MKDRLIGMLGVMGLTLVMFAAIPSADALAWSGGGGSNCGGTACESQGVGGELRCRPDQPEGTCIGCSCVSGANPGGVGVCKCQ